MTFREFWRRNEGQYKGVLFDIDGTLMIGGKKLPGADELLNYLRREQFPHYLLTNDGNNSLEQKSHYLRRGGLEVDPSEIISCNSILGELVKARQWEGKKFFIAGQLGEPCYAINAGLEVTRDPEIIDQCYGVIQGEGEYDWYNHWQAVLNFFRRHSDRPYIVSNPDTFWPGKPGEIGVGAGGQARAIAALLAEVGVQIKPIYLGKPYRLIYEYALKKMNEKFKVSIAPGEVIMLGDSLQSDIAGANNAGMASGLLLTGITTLEMAQKATPADHPRFIFESL